MRKPQIRPIKTEGDLSYITLTKGYEAIIDTADIPLISSISWHASISRESVYASGMHVIDGARRSISLHKTLLKPPKGFQVDHINCNGLDNRRSNLRLARQSQNMWNQGPKRNSSSGLKGVSFNARQQKWKAQIKAHGVRKYLGMFDKPEDAYKAYCEASKDIHGEFSRTVAPQEKTK